MSPRRVLSKSEFSDLLARHGVKYNNPAELGSAQGRAHHAICAAYFTALDELGDVRTSYENLRHPATIAVQEGHSAFQHVGAFRWFIVGLLIPRFSNFCTRMASLAGILKL